LTKGFPTLGCCGLDCGLCPRFYTHGSSRCPGCFGEDFANKHPSCSIINCCFKEKGLEVCGECLEYPCAKFSRETFEKDSFISHQKVEPNNNNIREYGLERFLAQQKQRIEFLETFLDGFDEGRSKSFFCLAAALLCLDNLGKALEEAEKEIGEKGIGKDDLKGRNRILKGLLKDFAGKENKELKLRK